MNPPQCCAQRFSLVRVAVVPLDRFPVLCSYHTVYVSIRPSQNSCSFRICILSKVVPPMKYALTRHVSAQAHLTLYEHTESLRKRPQFFLKVANFYMASEVTRRWERIPRCQQLSICTAEGVLATFFLATFLPMSVKGEGRQHGLGN